MGHLFEHDIKALLSLGILANFNGKKFFDKNHEEAAKIVKDFKAKETKKNGKLSVAVKKQIANILAKSFDTDTKKRLLTETRMLAFLVKETFQIINGDSVEKIYEDSKIGMRSYPIHLNKVTTKTLNDIFSYAKKVHINISHHPKDRKSIWVVIRKEKKEGAKTAGRKAKSPVMQILIKNDFRTTEKNSKGVQIQLIANSDFLMVKNNGLEDKIFNERIKEIQKILKEHGYKTTKRLTKKYVNIYFRESAALKASNKAAAKISAKEGSFLQSLSEIQKEKLLKELDIIIPKPAEMDDKGLITLFETLGQERVVSILKKAFQGLTVFPKEEAL